MKSPVARPSTAALLLLFGVTGLARTAAAFDVGEGVLALDRLSRGLPVGCERELIEVAIGGPMIRRISVPNGADTVENGPFFAPLPVTVSFSGDGRKLAYDSRLVGLVPGDTNGEGFGSGDDVFVRDLDARATARVSTSGSGEQGDRESNYPVLSRDGRYVAFQSLAANLSDLDDVGTDIFVKRVDGADPTLGAVELVSQTTDGVPSDFEATNPAISEGGCFIVFQSPSDSLRTLPTIGKPRQIYLRDRCASPIPTTEMLTVSFNGENAGFSQSTDARVNADGRFVVFGSTAFNLVENDPDSGTSNVFLWDRNLDVPENKLAIISLDHNGDPVAGSHPWISADGRFVTFVSGANGVVPDDDNFRDDVFLRDREMGTTERVSVGSGGVQGDDGSALFWHAPVSDDGRYVAFHSDATNLVADDDNNNTDVYVRDRKRNLTARVDTDLEGRAPGLGAAQPALSPDGCLVAFPSLDNDLTEDDTQTAWDYFVAVNPLFTLRD
ncbi:MAG: hypothetical protein KC466_04625 [Myxococcales bacterium]|nr:hypothetical protein [Myxococcales bacterium]